MEKADSLVEIKKDAFIPENEVEYYTKLGLLTIEEKYLLNKMIKEATRDNFYILKGRNLPVCNLIEYGFIAVNDLYNNTPYKTSYKIMSYAEKLSKLIKKGIINIFDTSKFL